MTFTVETLRKMKLEDLEEKAAEVWDYGVEDGAKLFYDSYGFSVVED